MNYYLMIQSSILKKRMHFINVDYDYQLDKDDVMTEYEEKFRSMGNKIYRLIVSKENK